MIPGSFIALLTFPGVILHEFAHQEFCQLFNIPVYEVRYFQLGEDQAGYVKHGKPESFSQTFWISAGPLFLNSLLAVLFAAIATKFRDDSLAQIAVGWLSISAAMHAFPSTHDAENIQTASQVARANGGSILLLLAYPFVAAIVVANHLRFVWFDALYAYVLFQLGTRAVG